jgi:hypothetical protein
MTEFRVFGDKLINYYIDVEASDESEAFQKADESDSSQWQEIEDDNTIESYSAEIKNERLFTNS